MSTIAAASPARTAAVSPQFELQLGGQSQGWGRSRPGPAVDSEIQSHPWLKIITCSMWCCARAVPGRMMQQFTEVGMSVYKLGGDEPVLAASAYVAPNAAVI